MKKKCPVVMLATEKAIEVNNIVLRASDNKLIRATNSDIINIIDSQSNASKSQHLYVLSDDEIKEGDWVLMNDEHPDGKLRQIVWISKEPNQFAWNKTTDKWDIPCNYLYLQHPKQGAGFLYSTECKKIIATTNPELWKDGVVKISLDFVNAYIKDYNKGEQIKEVMVEYKETEVFSDIKGRRPEEITILVPKVSSNGTISITPVEERKYTREEMKEACKWSFAQGYMENRVDEKWDTKFFEPWFNKHY